MTKEQLADKKKFLSTDNNVDFLLGLKKEELERLFTVGRERCGSGG